MKKVPTDPVIVFLNRWHWRGEEVTLHDAITALLTEYRLEEFTEFWRDEVKGEGWPGYSETHPKVVRFKQIVETLQAAQLNGGGHGERHNRETH